jgi:hypothetical protein
MFNFWRRYPRRKPKENGKYLCTVQYGDNLENSIVTELYYDYIDGGKWLDTKRQSVFDGYKVFAPGRHVCDATRVHTDSLCKRDFVVAWKKLPAPYVSLFESIKTILKERKR